MPLPHIKIAPHKHNPNQNNPKNKKKPAIKWKISDRGSFTGEERGGGGGGGGGSKKKN